MVRSSALRLFRASYVGVITLAAFVNGQLHPVSPADYLLKTLNDCCNSQGCQETLQNATFMKSAVIVKASQFRHRRGAYQDGCTLEITATEPDNLIVSVVEANLRQGLMDDSCIDYYKARDKASRLVQFASREGQPFLGLVAIQ